MPSCHLSVLKPLFTNGELGRWHLHSMKVNLRIIGRVGAALAFLFCLLGGVWMLKGAFGGNDGDNTLLIGMGCYFVGKAFFVGPMLWLTTERFCGGKDAE